LYIYRRWLKYGENAIGVQVGWSPHSPRSGFASEARAHGLSFEETREAGRWVSDSSLRIYLDIVEAVKIGTTLATAGLVDAQAAAVARWLDYCSDGALALSAAQVRAPPVHGAGGILQDARRVVVDA